MAPNLASAHGRLGATLIHSGRPRDGLASLETCIRLDPRDPLLVLRLNHMTMGLYYSCEYAAAVEAAKRAIRLFPDFPSPYRYLAAALGQLGRTEEARIALDEATAIVQASFDMYVRGRAPWIQPEDHAHILKGLRKAGWTG
jgi:adenylate cyclase